MINEVKSWQVKTLHDAVYGKNKLVHTWGIMSAENPMGKRQSHSINRSAILGLKQSLKQRGLDYIPVKGKYGSKEHSLFIINVKLSEMMFLSYQYDQESFIFAECHDGYSDAVYYEKGVGKNSRYVAKYRRNDIINMEDANDLFTSIKSHSNRAFKFQIPFPIGNVEDEEDIEVKESIVKSITRYLIEHYGYQGIDNLSKRINETFSHEISLRHCHSLRAEIYETRINKIRRYKDIIESLEQIREHETTERGYHDVTQMICDVKHDLSNLLSMGEMVFKSI